MNKRHLLILLGVTIILAGCTMPRQITLFSGESSQLTAVMPPEYLIEPGDVLQIEFSSINAEAISPYNSAGTKYIVREDGTVTVPILGVLTLSGKTTREAVDYLTGLVQGQVRESIVRLTITNAAVTVLGEVQRPGCLMAEQPITMTEALGSVGGLTHNAKCKDVLVQRRENGQVKQYHVNLLNNDLLTSPCYYLQKGDVVYVAPLRATH